MVYVTDEQCSRRPIFNGTLRPAASWLFFLRRGGSTRMNPVMGTSLMPVQLDRLEKLPTDLRRRHHLYARRYTSLLGFLRRRTNLAQAIISINLSARI